MNSGAPDRIETGSLEAREIALNFECELAALRASKDGVRITLLVHPQEGCIPAFLEIGINKRLIVSAVPIGDDEEIAPPRSLVEGARAVRKAAMLCRNTDFHEFATRQSYIQPCASPAEAEDACKFFVRAWCQVKSRSDIKYDPSAQQRLSELIGEFTQWEKAKLLPPDYPSERLDDELKL